jgi:hypothetical protein
MSFSIPPPMLTMTFSVRKISRFSFSCSRARACLCYDNGAFCVTTTENASDAMRLEMIICDNERSDESSFLVSSRAGVEEKSLSLF